jgi:acetylornithine/LysW-gamma-L-lysine aminotransferase
MAYASVYDVNGLMVKGGEGAELLGDDGRYYVDFSCGHGAAIFGHAHPRLTEALREASERPWTVGSRPREPHREVLLEKLGSLLDDGKAFLCNSGAEAIEAALKLATVLRPDRKRILALRRSFHGRTLGALSLTFNPRYRNPWRHLLVSVEHISMEEAAEAVDENTAAVFVEPVQGEGGVYVMPKSTGEAITSACRKHGVILVADEIQSGWGRCGKMLASPLVGLDPDTVCLAKGVAGGLPVGAVVWKGSLGDFPAMGHGSTYGGNPLVSSVALAAWEMLHEDGFLEQTMERAERFRAFLLRIKSPCVKEVRGTGLMYGVELSSIKATPLLRALQDKGVVALPAGPTVVRFLPPFVAQDHHFDRVASAFIEVLEECLDE